MGSVRRGKKKLNEELEDLKLEVREWYGYLAELSMGVVSPTPPEKPEIVKYIDVMKDLNIPLTGGGLMDQPVIWIHQYMAARNEIQIHEALREANRRSMAPQAQI